jgi:hypothetical protein
MLTYADVCWRMLQVRTLRERHPAGLEAAAAAAAAAAASSGK